LGQKSNFELGNKWYGYTEKVIVGLGAVGLAAEVCRTVRRALPPTHAPVSLLCYS
jgi:hypothetical protein